MVSPIRVLVVDDSTFMRGALVRMIEKDSRFKVIDTAVNGKEGVEKAQVLQPDVITMDVEMPVMTGIEALTEIMRTVKIPVIMVSTLTESGATTTLRALEIGAFDFIPKALNDKDKNIFRGAELIHEKLLAAAQSRGAQIAPAPAQTTSVSPQPLSSVSPHPATPSALLSAPAMKVPLPAPSKVARVTAKTVVIGSSTGGPKALQQVISQLPAGLPVPVLVAQHMPPQFTLALAKRLDETCPIKVVEAQAGMVPQPGTVYIAPGGMHMRLEPTGLRLNEDVGESPYKPSVDVLAESVRNLFGKQVLGVMLTGMGADGAREFKRLKDQGAHIIAQDQASSVVYGMPRAVVENGGTSEVLALDAIGPRIRTLLSV